MTNTDSMKSRKYVLGEVVVGFRTGSPGHMMAGELIHTYVTLNKRPSGITYRNAAYVIDCFEDGKCRSFQKITSVPDTAHLNGYIKSRARWAK